jgi:DNA-binding transcriptional regulator of glucitol operon
MWTSGRAVSLHVALVIVIPGCVALTWWQVSRALGGNTLSWVYPFEWPLFGAYATYMWWKLVHDEPAPDGPPVEEEGVAVGSGENDGDGDTGGDANGDDDELAAYNRYLADLNASGRQKRW